MQARSAIVSIMLRRNILRLLFLTLIYVGLNLLFINFVPLVHEFTFTIEVRDAQTNMPIPNAIVSWLRYPGDCWESPIGRTNSIGVLIFIKSIQEQPLWIFPLVGNFKFYSRALQISAYEYRVEVVDINSVLSNVSYSTPFGTVRVLLKREKN